MAYLLDTNVFIQAKNLHYGLDFCPAFWDWLVAENAAKKVFSIEKVEDEINGGTDELSEWAKARGSAFFLRPDKSLPSRLARVSAWAAGGRYDPAAVNTFLQVADYYLVAQALLRGDVVVTHEVASTTKKRIKIPDACIGLGVKHMTPYTMLRHERARFILGGRKS